MTAGSRVEDRPVSRPLRGGTRRSKGINPGEWRAAYLFLLPDAIGLLIFLVTPIVLGLGLAFFHASGFGDYTFVGLDNYRRMFNDPKFLKSVHVTIVYTLILVPSLFVVGMALALLVQQRLPLGGVIRTLFFLPNVVSLVVIGLVWNFLLVDRIGILNKAVRRIGLPAQSWLGDPKYALGTVLVVSVWFLMGFYMVIFLGGLQEIPPEYYDAARIDGAGYWEMFRTITLPLLKPTSLFVLVISLVAAVAGGQGFDLIYVMTKGGPADATSLLAFYVYQQAFVTGDYGYAAAAASFLVVALLILTGLMFALTRGGRFEFD